MDNCELWLPPDENASKTEHDSPRVDEDEIGNETLRPTLYSGDDIPGLAQPDEPSIIEESSRIPIAKEEDTLVKVPSTPAIWESHRYRLSPINASSNVMKTEANELNDTKDAIAIRLASPFLMEQPSTSFVEVKRENEKSLRSTPEFTFDNEGVPGLSPTPSSQGEL